MNKVHVFQSIKGGVGCSTNAVGFSCWLASEYGEQVTLIDLGKDISSILSSQTLEKGVEVISHEGLGIASLTDIISTTEGYVVIDAGSTEMRFSREWASHLCLDNHYLSLRRAVTEHGLSCLTNRYDDMVVLVDEEAALTVKDCQWVTRLPLFFSVNRDMATGRTIDAGMFPTKKQTGNYCSEMVSA